MRSAVVTLDRLGSPQPKTQEADRLVLRGVQGRFVPEVRRTRAGKTAGKKKSRTPYPPPLTFHNQ